ncbi:MAG TPA: glycoside hydrolase family 16 protein [Spirochaetota bacterium]|nr:glycoside hydrolase family 16 protein [Spirochaetota bacterium]
MKNTFYCIILVSALLQGCGSSGGVKSDYPYDGEWTLTYEENFESSAAFVDDSPWTAAAQGLNWNNEDQAYVKSNVSVENGKLVLTAKKESWTGLSGRVDNPDSTVTRDYTSGELNSSLSWTYGRFEARMKVPRTKGILSAFWMTPADKSWPPEIDIVEILGSDTSKAYFTNHYGTSSSHKMNGDNHRAESDLADDFHVYAVEWEPDAIRWYIDGTLLFTSTEGVPDKASILRFSLPVGPDWEGDPDPASVFPQQLEVDWVKVYQKRVSLPAD